MPSISSPEEASALLERCFAAFDAAARAQFEKDGSVDCGSCGGAMLSYPASGPFGEALLASGQASGQAKGDTEVFLARALPQDVQTQHAEVEIMGTRAFMAVAEESGVKHARYWTYTD
jgi:hypothetical protein